eukprot:gene37254-44629_t
MYFGEMVGFFFSGLLVNSRIVLDGTNFGNWPCLFYIFGLLGLFWSPIWAYRAYECPESHPFISISEKEFIIEMRDLYIKLELNSR